MIGLTSIEVYNSIFSIMEENIEFKLYKLSDLMEGEDIFESVEIDVEKKLGNSGIVPQDLLDETKGPFILKEHRKTYQEKNLHTLFQS